MTGSRKALPEMNEIGEIGRLSANVKRLHDHSIQSFDLVQNASWTDTLTGISNREYFNIRSTQILQEAEAEDIGCTRFIDVDNFKFVNDKHGHKIGDELLKTLADRISAIVACVVAERGLPTGLFARLSGDEFAIMLRCQPGSGTITEGFRKILALFAEVVRSAGQGLSCHRQHRHRRLSRGCAHPARTRRQRRRRHVPGQIAGQERLGLAIPALHEKRNRQRRIERNCASSILTANLLRLHADRRRPRQR